MRVRLWASEQRGWLIGAAVLTAVAGLAFVLALTGPGHLQWTGTAVQGRDDGGIVSWSYGGQTGSIDRTSRFATTTVYVDPADPVGTAILEYPLDKLFEALTVAGPLGLAFACIAWSVVAEARRRSRARLAVAVSDFGHGLDRDVVHGILERRRAEELRRRRP